MVHGVLRSPAVAAVECGGTCLVRCAQGVSAPQAPRVEYQGAADGSSPWCLPSPTATALTRSRSLLAISCSSRSWAGPRPSASQLIERLAPSASPLSVKPSLRSTCSCHPPSPFGRTPLAWRPVERPALGPPSLGGAGQEKCVQQAGLGQRPLEQSPGGPAAVVLSTTGGLIAEFAEPTSRAVDAVAVAPAASIARGRETRPAHSG